MMEKFTQWMKVWCTTSDVFLAHRRRVVPVVASALLMLLMVRFCGCDNDADKLNAERKYLGHLSFTWNLQQVKINGIDVSPAFQGISLTLKGNRTFTVTNPVAPAWPANGTFALREISGTPDYDIVRSDGMQIHVSELSGSMLRLQMQYQPAGASVPSVEGRYEFTFVKQTFLSEAPGLGNQ